MARKKKFNLFLVSEGLASSIEFFQYGSGYGLRNEGAGGIAFTSIIYDILDLLEEMTVRYSKRRDSNNDDYLDSSLRAALDRLQEKVLLLSELQKEFADE